MSFWQPVHRDASAAWQSTAALVAAMAAPTLVTDGFALSGPSGMVQYCARTLVAVTDYDVILWGYVNGHWVVVQTHTLCGALPRGWEYPCAAFCTRYYVQLSRLVGTSLILQRRVL